jgi:hypothetical protein
MKYSFEFSILLTAVILSGICYFYYTLIRHFYDWDLRKKAETLSEEEKKLDSTPQ